MQQQECVGVEQNTIWKLSNQINRIMISTNEKLMGIDYEWYDSEYMENTCFGNVWFNVWYYSDPMLTFLLKLVLQS